MKAGFIVAIGVAIAASVGQIILKIAVNRQKIKLSESFFSGLLLDPTLWVGLGIYVICSVVWLWVLSKSDVSTSYPILSLSFGLVPLFAYLILREPVSLGQWLAIALIITGVLILQALS